MSPTAAVDPRAPLLRYRRDPPAASRVMPACHGRRQLLVGLHRPSPPLLRHRCNHPASSPTRRPETTIVNASAHPLLCAGRRHPDWIGTLYQPRPAPDRLHHAGPESRCLVWRLLALSCCWALRDPQLPHIVYALCCAMRVAQRCDTSAVLRRLLSPGPIGSRASSLGPSLLPLPFVSLSTSPSSVPASRGTGLITRLPVIRRICSCDRPDKSFARASDGPMNIVPESNAPLHRLSNGLLLRRPVGPQRLCHVVLPAVAPTRALPLHHPFGP